MSELINNREYRQKKLKELIMKLHEGVDFETVKKEFEENFGSISTSEISSLEQSIIMEGMPVEEVQRLCNVHSAVFKGSIEDIHNIDVISNTIGHPLNTFIRENEKLSQYLKINMRYHLDLFKEEDNQKTRNKLIKDLIYLSEIDKHYLRKENLLFPYLEKYGIYGPPKVMWGVDDEIRSLIKNAIQEVEKENNNQDHIISIIENVITQIEEMIFKEENILFPMSKETLSQDDWLKIQDESDEIGYSFIEKPNRWIPPQLTEEEKKISKAENIEGTIYLPTGSFMVKELELIFNKLPIDITFIDKDDYVKYFSQSSERIFPRTKAVIGRTVQNCHPPGSVHIVNKMIEDFKQKKKTHEDFWIKMKGIYAYIRYFAIYDENDEYVGCLEVTQNIEPLQKITGEKRLISE